MAVQRGTHPSADVLKAFALGKLSDTSADVVVTHLDQCRACRQEVAKTSAGKAPVANLPPELAANQQYEILRELGRGGMGVVYLAKNKLMDRLEVLKVVNKALLDHPGAVERFLREIRSAAKLSHANVVGAYHALQMGELLAFAMEYVEGQDLASLVKSQGPLSVPHACFYVQQAAAGLQHAFEKQMVHRDIKPQNLILAREGKKHIVKVLDFGLAKVMREKSEDTGLTGEGKMLGTPDYIAPEQTLDAAKADIRADIYSLGCTLYYLLSGHPPFSATSLGAILLAHQMQEAKPLNLVRPEVPEELAAVVRKMMAKTPAKRYQTPLEVVQALSPFVKQGATSRAAPELSVGATEPKPAVKVAVPVAPPPAPAAKEAKPPQPANVWESLTESSTESVGPRKSAIVRNPRTATVRERTAQKQWLLGGGLGVGVLLLAMVGMWAGGVFKVKAPAGILIVEVSEPNPDVYVDGDKVTVTWNDGGKKAEIRVKPGTHKVEVKKDGFTVHGEEVEIEDGKRRILTAKLAPPSIVPKDEQDREQAPPVPRVANTSDYDLTAGYRFVHFGKDSTRVLLRFNDDSQKQYFARVYDLTTGQALTPPLTHEDRVIHALFSPDGKRVVTASSNGTARVWDAATGQALTPLLKHKRSVFGASFSPDGKRVATASLDNTARVWDVATGTAITPPLQHDHWVHSTMFSPDGKRVVTASNDKTARIWDADTGASLAPPLQHEDHVYWALFSPDGQRVVTASNDKTARIWDAATGKEIVPPLKHENTVSHASFSPDGQRVATSTRGQQPERIARIWDAATGQPITPTLTHNSNVSHASFSPDGKRVVTTSQLGTARVWDAATGQQLGPPLLHESPRRPVLRASFTPDGKGVVTSSGVKGNTAGLWDVQSGQELKCVTIAPPPATPPVVADGFVPLFNGKDLTGWKTHPKAQGNWKVEGAILVGRGPQKSWLYSQRDDYENFHLLVEAKINQGGNSGIQFHKAFTPDFTRGYEAQIDSSSHKFKTGSLYIKGLPGVGIEKVLVPIDTWFTQEVIIQGNHILIKINGEKTADFVDADNTWPRGHIALQLFDAPTVVQFRRIEIKELPATKPETPRATAGAAEEKSFVPLFNGKNLSGWEGMTKYWSVKDGALVGYTPEDPGHNTFLCSKRQYRDFELKFKVRLKDGVGNSGVQIRSKLVDPQKFIVAGPQCDIGAQNWGSLYGEGFGGMMKPSSPDLVRKAVKLSDFNDYFIKCVGKHVTIKINDETMVDDDFPTIPVEGIIAWQLHGGFNLMEVTFKDIQFKELPATKSEIPPAAKPEARPAANIIPENKGFVPLFNGKDLKGWRTHPKQPGNWHVEKGVLIGSGPATSHLYSFRGNYRNFHLRVEARINDGGNSGVYFRAPFGPAFPVNNPASPFGYAAQIFNSKSGTPSQTGSLYAVSAAAGSGSPVRSVRESPVRSGDWFTMDVIAEGTHIVIKVNDKTTADYTDDKRLYTSGHIALQQQNVATVVEFRKIEIKERK